MHAICRRAALLFLFSLAACLPALAQTTATLQQGLNGYGGTTDAVIVSLFPDDNTGSDAVLQLKGEASRSLLIRFGSLLTSQGGPVPNGATITSATLSLYKAWGPDGVFKASRLLKAFSESNATWNAATSGTSWGTPGAFGASDVSATPDGQAAVGDAAVDNCSGGGAPAACWLHIDVTSGVQAIAGGTPNHGWKVAYVSGSDQSAGKEFHSSENTASTLRPRLTVSWIVDPGPIASMTATPTSGSGPLTVTFNASGSNDNGSAITGLRLEFGHNSQFVEWTDKNVPQQYTYPAGTAQYTARLTVTNANGTSEPAVRTISVDSSPCSGDNLPASPAAGALGTTVPTFHSMSLYYNPAGTPPGGQVWMRYRKACETAWREGHPLWFDPRTSGGNGSLPYAFRARGAGVHLEPATKYYFELGTGSGFGTATWHHHLAGTTWSETFPEGTVTPIPSQNTPFVITQGGSASAYRVYDGWNGSSRNVVDRQGQGTASGIGIDASHAIVVNAPFVIVRRVVARGAARAAIYIAPGITDVVIEDAVIEDWAWRTGLETDEQDNPNSWGTWGDDHAAGIHLRENNSRIVMQRNIIREPHFGSYPWDTGASCIQGSDDRNHPHGPNGITVRHGGQQNVIRYNEITGHPTDRNKWYLDGIGGGDNFGTQGTPGADSDIYQNIIMNVFDDAIQAEGGGRNVRIWGNYISDSMVAVGTTTTHFGPNYVWRNVVNRVRRCYQVISDTDDDIFTAAFKYGGFSGTYGDGIRYVYHNTLLQQPLLGEYGEGAGRGFEGTSNGGGSVRWTIARNNILHVRSDTASPAWSIESYDSPVGSVFDHNLFNGRYDTHLPAPDPDFEFSGSQVFYRPGHGWSSVPALGGNGTGNYQLETGSKGQDTWAGSNACAVIPMFNDGFTGSAPDCGAHENGAPPMKFGISAGQ